MFVNHCEKIQLARRSKFAAIKNVTKFSTYGIFCFTLSRLFGFCDENRYQIQLKCFSLLLPISVLLWKEKIHIVARDLRWESEKLVYKLLIQCWIFTFSLYLILYSRQGVPYWHILLKIATIWISDVETWKTFKNHNKWRGCPKPRIRKMRTGGSKLVL